MKISVYQNIEILIVIVVKDVSISRTIYSSKRVIISTQLNVIVSISRSRKALDLSNNRDLLFEL